MISLLPYSLELKQFLEQSKVMNEFTLTEFGVGYVHILFYFKRVQHFKILLQCVKESKSYTKEFCIQLTNIHETKNCFLILNENVENELWGIKENDFEIL